MRKVLFLAIVALALMACRTTGSATLADLQAKQGETDTHLGNVDAGLLGLEATTTGETHTAVLAVHAELKKAAATHSEETKLAAEAAAKVTATETKLEVKTLEVKEVKKERNRLAAIIAVAALVAAICAGMFIAKRLPFP